MTYSVTYSRVIDADSPEHAAVELDRLLKLSERPHEYRVTPSGQHAGSVFVRVARGEGVRIA